jgi:hypothetical protein
MRDDYDPEFGYISPTFRKNINTAVSALQGEAQKALDKAIKSALGGVTSADLIEQKTKQGVKYFDPKSQSLVAECIHVPQRTNRTYTKGKGGIVKNTNVVDAFDNINVYSKTGDLAWNIKIKTIDETNIGKLLSKADQYDLTRAKFILAGRKIEYVESMVSYFPPETVVVMTSAPGQKNYTDEQRRRDVERSKGRLIKSAVATIDPFDTDSKDADIQPIYHRLSTLKLSEENKPSGVDEKANENKQTNESKYTRTQTKIRSRISLNQPAIDYWRTQSTANFEFGGRIKGERINNPDGSYVTKQFDKTTSESGKAPYLLRKFDERKNQIYQGKFDADGTVKKESYTVIPAKPKKLKRKLPEDGVVKDKRLNDVLERELHEERKENAGVRSVEVEEPDHFGDVEVADHDYSTEKARADFAKSKPNSIAAQLAAKGKATMVQAIQDRYEKNHGPKK